ncbi:MAG: galactose-1-phosphate uridylyltransferase [Candidatus Tectomicrobia bacterium]|uniref:Galactose-1-phosphate uridylyltransferase n=1 Tax=Tectimicrobiota bacterium TaxID=2528274 RepID=A0A932CMP4_UNCTE|nr:galactose-1-phosphate uridylyltransferase [Candidatus Tectomicrobia bacterium]
MPELRKDPIIGRWVIIATERAKRPSDFSVVPEKMKGGFCPFCPGNEDKTPSEVLAYRSDGSLPNSPGWSLRVVPNRFPALRIEGDMGKIGDGMFDRMNGIGAHEVIIEAPGHDAGLDNLSERAMEDIIWSYRDRITDLRRDPRFRYIMIFKNQGAAAGASLEHTHSQLIALPVVPKRVIEELAGALNYYRYKERCVYCDIMTQELADGRRVVYENPDILVISPYAPRFPFETWIIPKTHSSSFEDSQKHEYENLARAFSVTLKKLCKALNHPPYNFVLHTAPLIERNIVHYHWHFELMPILTKVAGFEWGTGFYINPTPPEEAARFLRELEI